MIFGVFVSGMEDQFKTYENYEVDTGGTEYDYKSIMQYGNTAFTSNGKDTMDAKFDHEMKLGSDEMSQRDILELNKAYACNCK